MSKSRLNFETLSRNIPIIQEGRKASENLMHGNIVDRLESLVEQNRVLRRELAIEELSDLSMPLMVREAQKMLAGSRMKDEDGMVGVLVQAGLEGFRRGLDKFDEDKVNISSTNYLMQWFTAYARRELTNSESINGIPPSRFGIFKKIAAVRRKLSDEYQRPATNEEIHDYFQSGKADLPNRAGRVSNKDRPSAANRKIHLDIIKEQEEFELSLFSPERLDAPENPRANLPTVDTLYEDFDGTFFGEFLKSYPFTVSAVAVMKSDLQREDSLTREEREKLAKLSETEIAGLLRRWKWLMMDPNGVFVKFLRANRNKGYDQFDVSGTLEIVEKLPAQTHKYDVLFERDGEGCAK